MQHWRRQHTYHPAITSRSFDVRFNNSHNAFRVNALCARRVASIGLSCDDSWTPLTERPKFVVSHGVVRSSKALWRNEDNMNPRLRVKLNLAAIVDHLSREEGRALSQADVLAWLSDAGFTRGDDDWWIVREADLGQVEPTEVTQIEPLNEPDSE
jgi:hypothetical protein